MGDKIPRSTMLSNSSLTFLCIAKGTVWGLQNFYRCTFFGAKACFYTFNVPNSVSKTTPYLCRRLSRFDVCFVWRSDLICCQSNWISLNQSVPNNGGPSFCTCRDSFATELSLYCTVTLKTPKGFTNLHIYVLSPMGVSFNFSELKWCR